MPHDSFPFSPSRVSVSHVECQTRNLSTQSGHKFSRKMISIFPRKRNEIPRKLHSQHFLNLFCFRICCSSSSQHIFSYIKFQCSRRSCCLVPSIQFARSFVMLALPLIDVGCFCLTHFIPFKRVTKTGGSFH